MPQKLIAFTGFGRVGKDEAAKPIIAAGHRRVAFGDIIKGQVDSLVQKHFGFSAFTEVSAEKSKIRRTLESWGEDNYDAIFREFFAKLPERAVNTRLCRVREAREWRKRGGVIVEVVRPGVGPETEWARTQVADLHANGLVDFILHNNAAIADIHKSVETILLG